MSGSPIPVKATSRLVILQETFIWEIKDFVEIAKSDSMINSQTMEFDVVDRDGQSSKWKVFLYIKADEVGVTRWVGIFYRAAEGPEAYDEDLLAKMQFALKDKAGEETWSYETALRRIPELRERGWGFSQMINAAKEPMPETLEIHLKFQLHFPGPAKPTFAAKVRQDIGKLLRNPISGEVVIRSKDKVEFTMPRGILAARSPVFDAMFRSDMTEAIDGIISIPDIGGKALEVFLHFLLVGELLPTWKDTDVIAELTNAAAKYQLQDLLTFLDGMLGNVCDLENVASLFILANQLPLKTAKEELLKFIREKGAGSAENFVQLMKIINAMDNVPL